MFWKKHKKKILWGVVALIVALCLVRAAPTVYEVILYRRVWIDDLTGGQDEFGNTLKGWYLEPRFGGGQSSRGGVVWCEETGWLRTRSFISGDPKGDWVQHITVWGSAGSIKAQHIFESSGNPHNPEAVDGPPWRWGEKPRTPATWWMKARWIP